MSLTAIEKATSKLAPGRAPYYIEAHLVKALLLIDTEGAIGRVRLSKTIGLGEGTVRTLIKHLEKADLIKTSRKGILPTEAGRRLIQDLKARMGEKKQISRSDLTVGPFNVAILVRNAAPFVRKGLEQRDAAIKVGALGATTLVFQREKLKMPFGNEDAAENDAALLEKLVSELSPRENDVVIIGTANDRSTAELGALAAALETMKAAHGNVGKKGK